MSGFNARFPPKPPLKRSVFERQRAEAEAKRQRDNAETAAVYEEFVKSFDDGGDGGASAHERRPPLSNQQQPPPPPKITIGSVGGRRHFSMPTASGSGLPGARNSGPGSLGPVPGSTNTDKRRAFADSDDDDSAEEGQVLDTAARTRTGGSTAAERAEERAAAKPTMRLANMPPGTSPAAIKALVTGSSSLTVDGVRILPAAAAASASTTTERKAVAAIVTLAAETAASDIDATVSALQNRYLGFGYYLTLHRHLSSAVAASSTASLAIGSAAVGGSSSSAHPFGAKPVSSAPPKAEAPMGFAPPPSYHQHQHHGASRFATGFHGRGVPPPASYGGPPVAAAAALNREGILYVPVQPPRDIKQLRMIHKVIENVLSQGPAFEALLMSRPEVQRDEKWAWLWDARSTGGVWYRYRLWQIVSGLQAPRGVGRYVPLFEGSHAWKLPDNNPLPFEFATSLEELADDAAYHSSDDDSDDDEGGADTMAKESAAGIAGEDTFLNPLEKARLVHLLARLPTSLTRLRKGDVARVTAFAIGHASRGADEVVETIVANVERPFAYTRANPQYEPASDSTITDTSGAQLVAVYVVSDILSSSATSGIRHAWRFRQLFEAALRRRAVFAGLGRLPDRLRWGRLRADKWRRSIALVLSQWDGWSVFSAETQAYLVGSFEGAATTTSMAKQPEAETTTAMAAPKKSRWKTVDTTVEEREMRAAHDDNDTFENVDDAAYRSDYTDDEALDLAVMDDEDIDGVPLDVAAGRLHAYLDGVPLTADEVHALVGSEAAELSEEGEIGTDDGDDDDDDEYYMSVSASEDEAGMTKPVDKPEVKPADESAPDTVPPTSDTAPPTSTTAAPPTSSTTAPAETRGTDSSATSSSVLDGRSVVPRKRMRAADMFADD